MELTISDSTQQNCESAPRQNNIKKNKIDQRPEGSSCRTTCQYKRIKRQIQLSFYQLSLFASCNLIA